MEAVVPVATYASQVPPAFFAWKSQKARAMAIGAGNGSGGGATEGGYSGGVYWWTSNNLLTPQDPENISTGISSVSQGTSEVSSFLSSKGIAITSWDGASGEGAISQAVSKALEQCQGGNRTEVCRLFGVGAFVSTYLASGSRDFDGSGSGAQNDSQNSWQQAFKKASSGTYTAWNGRSVSYTASTNLGGGKTIDSVVASQIAEDASEDLSIVVVLLNQSEPLSLVDELPSPPSKTIGEGTLASGMDDPTQISTSTGEGGSSLIFQDFLQPNGSTYQIKDMQVNEGSRNISSSFSFSSSNNLVEATWHGGDLPPNQTFSFSFNVQIENASGKPFQDQGKVVWDGKTQETPQRSFSTFVPTVNKAWCGKASQADPEKTNKAGWDEKYFVEGESVSSSVNGEVGANLYQTPSDFSLTDNFSPVSSIWKPDVSKAEVLESNGALAWEAGQNNLSQNATSEFDITQNGNEITASMKPAFLSSLKGLQNPLQFTLFIPGAICINGGNLQGEREEFGLSGSETLQSLLSPSKKAFVNEGSETLGAQTEQSNQPGIGIYVPGINKSWEIGKSQADPTWSGTTGSDKHYFLNGQTLDSSINAEVGANLGGKISSFSIDDNYANSAWMWKPDPSAAQVYSSSLQGAENASLSNMASGQNVTNEFYFIDHGYEIEALMKPEYLSGLVDLKNPVQFTLTIPGSVDLDKGMGIQGARKAYGKTEGEGVSTLLNPGSSIPFSDTASENLGSGQSKSNSPKVGIWIPKVVKSVIGGKAQGGGDASINGKTVMLGQVITYELEADELVPLLLRPISSIQIRDQYSPYVTPFPSSLQVFQNGDLLPLSDYEVSWNGQEHEFQVTLLQKDAAAWKSGSKVELLAIFKARVNKDGKTIENKWDLVLNGSSAVSNTVQNPSLLPAPSKAVDNSLGENVDGKTVLQGNILYYKVKLEAADLKNLAYKVQRLGIIDHFDWKCLKWLIGKTQILNASGKNVRSEFNVQEDDRTAYVFFKTANTFVKATGKEIPGNPQPANLEAYSKENLNPLLDPSIDQSVLGQNYTVILPMEVYGNQNGTIENTALQETNSQISKSNTVVNVEKKIEPEKTVSLTIGGKSEEGQEIPLGSDFYYGLESSTLPSNRAYPKVSDWSFNDAYESGYDKYLGVWKAFSDYPMHIGGKEIGAGSEIAGSGFKSPFSNAGPLMDVENKGGVLMAWLTPEGLKAFSSPQKEGFKLYLEFQRIKPSPRVTNVFSEDLNGINRESNEVWTWTPSPIVVSHPVYPNVQAVKRLASTGIDVADIAGAALGLLFLGVVLTIESRKKK